MSRLELLVAFLPLALYAGHLYRLHAADRPRLVGGGLDKVRLGLALSGVLLVGPMKYFLLLDSFAFWETLVRGGGFFVWIMLYFLLVVAITWLSLRIASWTQENLVLYNTTVDELTEPLQKTLFQLDPDCRQAGKVFSLPTLGVQFYLVENRPFRNVTLIATGRDQATEAWQQLEKRLAAGCEDLPVRRNGVRWIFAAVFLLLVFTLLYTGAGVMHG